MYPENSTTAFSGTWPCIFLKIYSRTIAMMIETPSLSLYLATIFDFEFSNCLTSITYKVNVSWSRSSVSQIFLIALRESSYLRA